LTKHCLNIYGLLVFQNRQNKHLFAERPYRNIDRIIFTDETRGLREYAGECKYSEFDKSEWILITEQEYKMIKYSYKELSIIREAISLNNSIKKLNLVEWN
jgi:hypothetical protein